MSRDNLCDAVVLRVDEHHAWVQTASRQPACGACGQRTQCASLEPASDGQVVRVEKIISVRPGDRVTLQLSAGKVWRAAWQAYALPLLLAMGLAVLGQWAAGSDAVAGIGVLLGLGIGFALLRRRRLDSQRDAPIFALQSRITHNF